MYFKTETIACNDYESLNDFSSNLWGEKGSVCSWVVQRCTNSTPENDTRLNQLLSVTEDKLCNNWRLTTGYRQADFYYRVANFFDSVQGYFLWHQGGTPTRAGNILALVGIRTESDLQYRSCQDLRNL